MRAVLVGKRSCIRSAVAATVLCLALLPGLATSAYGEWSQVESIHLDTWAPYADGPSLDHMTASVLDPGVRYRFVATGYFRYAFTTPAESADAAWKWNWDQGWVKQLFVQINSDPTTAWLGSADGSTWGEDAYSPSHTYRYETVGSGAKAMVSFVDTYYLDNSGGLDVALYRGDAVPEPAPCALALACLASCAVLTLRRRR